MRVDLFVQESNQSALCSLIARGRKISGEMGERARRIPSQMGEMGAFAVSFLVIFLISSVDLPILASCSLANLRFARRCWGVCACAPRSAWVVVVEWRNARTRDECGCLNLPL